MASVRTRRWSSTRAWTSPGLLARFRDGTNEALCDTLAAVHNCARPVRLAGSSTTIDARTGEVLSTFRSADAPLGVLYRPCGNRRAHVCPACSRTYARDTFALISAGVAGGKTVPEQVADNPLLFATFTAPSFGLVHGHRGGRPCRPRRRDDRTRCPHGRPQWCTAVHEAGRRALGCSAVPGLLRHRVGGHLAVARPRAVAAHDHRPAPSRRRPPRGDGDPAWASTPRSSTPRSRSTRTAAWSTSTP